MRLSKRVALSLTVLLQVFSGTAFAAYNVHVSGNFYTYVDGKVVPLANARVEIMDSDSDTDTILDDTMGTGNTDSNGHFEIDGVGGDGGSYWWSKPDVYARVDLSDDYPGPKPPAYGGKSHPVRCTDELNSARGHETPQHSHDNVSGNIDLGSFIWGSSSQSTAPSVWLTSREAFIDYVARFHEIPPAGHYDIEYWSGIWSGTPWTNLDTTHWPRHYPTGSTNPHEFAHSVRHSFDGGQNHFNWDVTRFRYARYHAACDNTNGGFAFNEGWAEFWERQTCGANTPLNMEVEGDVADGLDQVARCCEAKTAGLLQVLRANPGRIHSFADFRREYEARFHDNCANNVRNPSRISSSHVPLVVSEEEQRSWVSGEVTAQSAEITRLQRRLAQARIAAARFGRRIPRDSAYAAFQTLIRPHFLRAELDARKAARERVRSEVRDWALTATHVRDGTLNPWYQARKKTYLQRIGWIYLNALRSAVRAAAPLEGTAEGRVLFHDLQEKLAAYRRRLSIEGVPPPSVQPGTMTDDEFVRTTRRPNR